MIMSQRIQMSRIILIWLLVGATVCLSEKVEKSARTSDRTADISSPEHAKESRWKTSYRGAHEPEHHYSDHEDGEHYHSHSHPSGKGKSGEYHHSDDAQVTEQHKHHHRHHQGHLDHKGHESSDYAKQGHNQEAEKAGSSFDKHHKDQKINNKELENVKQHEVAEKHGGEMTKDKKIGKLHDKSKGHKSHGFKNVYHKEEYGNHKTFHDEFLDNDHHHDYDNQHEHLEHQGGKFSKGYRHQGKNDKHDKGDEKRSWGQSGHDRHQERHHRKGGHHLKNQHANKDNKKHEEGNSHHSKHSQHKIRKGTIPPYSHHAGHHGPHPSQIQHYNGPHYHHQHQNVRPHLHHSIHPHQHHNSQPHQVDISHQKPALHQEPYDETPPTPHHHHGGHHFIQNDDDNTHVHESDHHGHHHGHSHSEKDHEDDHEYDNGDHRPSTHETYHDEQLEDHSEDHVSDRQPRIPVRNKKKESAQYKPRHHDLKADFEKERKYHRQHHPRHATVNISPSVYGPHEGLFRPPHDILSFQASDKHVNNKDNSELYRGKARSGRDNYRYYTRHHN